VVEVDLDNVDATALGIALNRTSELGAWDLSALGSLLESLRAEEAFDAVGFDQEEMDELLASVMREGGGLEDIVQDEVPAPPDAATTRPGDLWTIGIHRLQCGNSGSPVDLDRLLASAPVHLVNADPPYNVRVEPRSNNAIAAGLSSFTGTTHHQGLDLARHPSPCSSNIAPRSRSTHRFRTCKWSRNRGPSASEPSPVVCPVAMLPILLGAL
jgi:hypothetical protein